MVEQDRETRDQVFASMLTLSRGLEAISCTAKYSRGSSGRGGNEDGEIEEQSRLLYLPGDVRGLLPCTRSPLHFLLLLLLLL